MKRTEIGKLKSGKEAIIHGWVETVRDQKSIMFVIIRDRSGMVQVTVKKENVPDIAEKLVSAMPGSSTVVVRGNVVSAPNVKLGGIEIIPTNVEITSNGMTSPIDEDSGLDIRLDYRWIDLRDEKKRDWFTVQTIVMNAMRQYFVQNNFIEINTPKLTAHSTEGGAEVFEVKYFDRKVYLTQSPQLFKQMSIAAGFEKVFEFGACYRAEKSHTSRHATEFFALDVELGFIKNDHCVMDVEEDMLKFVFKHVQKNCADIFERLGVPMPEFPKKRIPRITLLEAYNLLMKERGYAVPKASKGDLDPEGERLLCEISKEKYGSDFIFITNYPSSARAFYIMREPNNNKITRGFDLLYRGVELTSGGMREHNAEALCQNIRDKGMNPEDLEFYIQFFEYGCPPHGGFALGYARLLAKMLNLSSIKDITFLFRGPDRIAP